MSQTGMNALPAEQLDAPRVENGKPLLIAGLRSHYTDKTMSNIPTQWERFAPYVGKISGQVGRAAYGVCLNASNGVEGIDYLSGVEVSSSSSLPSEFSLVTIPAQRYAVFSHREHVSKLRETLDAIWQKWLPESGYKTSPGSAETRVFFERYAEDFEARTGMGGIEVWIPINS